MNVTETSPYAIKHAQTVSEVTVAYVPLDSDLQLMVSLAMVR